MCTLVTKKAPDFTANAVLGDNTIVGDFNLYQNIGDKGAVVFFYPLDFTFVCPSELIAFDHRLKEFKDRGIKKGLIVFFLSGIGISLIFNVIPLIAMFFSIYGVILVLYLIIFVRITENLWNFLEV